MTTDDKYRRHAHESTGTATPCQECGGTGKIDLPHYAGRCLRCDGIGKTVVPALIDGTYCLEPDGGAWIGVQIRDGKMVSMTEEANAATHEAAGDGWAGFGPSDEHEQIDGDLAARVVREVMGADADPDCVVVSRV